MRRVGTADGGTGCAGPERGSGTVLAIGLISMIASLLVAALLVSAVAVTGQRARTAADLAALAGAGRTTVGDEPGACATAREVALRNDADLLECRVAQRDGGGASPSLPTVEVLVARQVGDTQWRVTARARAGGVVPP